MKRRQLQPQQWLFMALPALLSGATNLAHAALAPYPSHLYELNGSFADYYGGPSMVSGGGTLGGSGYTFGSHQGPNVSNAVNANTYSIEMRFKIDDLGSFKHLLNFNNLTADAGLYEASGTTFISMPGIPGYGNPPAITAGAFYLLTVTRDGGTQLFRAYVNGVSQFSFTDSSGYTSFSQPNNIINFLIDNNLGGENPTGVLDYVHIYTGVLDSTQVAGLASGAITPFQIPEPASIALLGLGTAALFKRRR